MTGKRQSMSGFRFDDTGVFVPVVKLQSSGSREALTAAGQDKISRSPALFRKTKKNVRSVSQSTSTFRTYLPEDKKNTEGGSIGVLSSYFLIYSFIHSTS